MDYVRFQHLFQAEGLRLGQAAVTDMDAPVPSCPGWTVADVVRHSVLMYTDAAGQLRPQHRPVGGDPLPVAGSATKGDLLDTYTRAHAALVTEMARRDPLDPIEGENLDPGVAEGVDGDGPDPGTAGFLIRRMAREAAVHRADIEMAVGTPGPLDAQQSLDGIDEVLGVLLPAHYDGSARDGASGRTIGVHSNRHHWRLTMQRSGVAMSRDQGFADAAVSGEPAELLLYLWGRRPGTVVSQTGDRTVLAAFRRRLAVSMV
ncbi:MULTISPECIES: maleylpyruvate isomerase family mycothiol-dependent enzyme [unclassified Embleya]|uniref:maleylpyruvate isomerase family mycothiol-dependent enzyme n=1 Tax=unclassified Embleya TaxID=2699296 RepID=UPI0033E19B6C